MGDDRVMAFTGGGTGGHIYPGLAVIESLRKCFSGRIIWIGSKKDSDRATVEAAGVEYFSIPSGKLRRELSLKNLADAFRVLAGYFAARRILAREKPVLLFSKGGYVSVPPCRAAADLGIPYITHESDLTMGLATRLNARRAERLLVSYGETRAGLAPALADRTTVVGNPIRAAIRAGDAARGRAILGVEAGLPVVFFIGGSQGARQVNGLVLDILPELAKMAFVVHQTGDTGIAQAEEAARAMAAADGGRAGRYRPYAYIRDELPDILAAADLVVGRAGAASLWEASALSKPMVLIPLAGTGTRGDQVDNARLFEEAGAATVLTGEDANPGKLLETIGHYLDDPEARKEAGLAARELAGSDAAGDAAALIMALLGGDA